MLLSETFPSSASLCDSVWVKKQGVNPFAQLFCYKLKPQFYLIMHSPNEVNASSASLLPPRSDLKNAPGLCGPDPSFSLDLLALMLGHHMAAQLVGVGVQDLNSFFLLGRIIKMKKAFSYLDLGWVHNDTFLRHSRSREATVVKSPT